MIAAIVFFALWQTRKRTPVTLPTLSSCLLVRSLQPEGVVKSIKALNHEEHEGHQGKEKLFFVLFVVPFFSGPFLLRQPRHPGRRSCSIARPSQTTNHPGTPVRLESHPPPTFAMVWSSQANVGTFQAVTCSHNT